jgi:hypothetical protein
MTQGSFLVGGTVVSNPGSCGTSASPETLRQA